MNYQTAIKGYTGVIQAYALATRTHDSLSADAWAVLSREVDAALKNGKTVDDIKAEMKAAEDAWKASTGDTAMPSTYRSAKAVALKAAASGVALITPEGEVVGKTAVESAYKSKAASTADEKEGKDPWSKAKALAIKLCDLASELSPAEKASIMTTLAANFK